MQQPASFPLPPGSVLSMIVSVIAGGAPTPITAVGSRVIDATPGAVKDWAIRTLGENDKPFLLAGIYTAIAVLAAVTGLLAWRSRRLALGLATVLGLIGLAAAVADRTSLVGTTSKLAPAIAALLVSVGFLYLFTRSWTRPRYRTGRAPTSKTRTHSWPSGQARPKHLPRRSSQQPRRAGLPRPVRSLRPEVRGTGDRGLRSRGQRARTPPPTASTAAPSSSP